MTQPTNTYFTSDTHWSHKNIPKFCPDTRRGETIEEMNELLIEGWNTTVPKNGIVYHIGDFSFGKTVEEIKSVVERLNGEIHLILGNHDFLIRKTPELRALFASVHDYKRISLNKTDIILCHFPIARWDKMHVGSIHFHGHTHGKYQCEGRGVDVGIDARPDNRMLPWKYEELYEIAMARPVITDGGD